MSVLIKGLKMPTSCLKGGCPIDGFHCQLWEDKYWSRVESPEKMRHRDCPMIELPDHGDLIDRSALLARYAEEVKPSNNSDFMRPPRWNDAVQLTELAPVVIPVERSEDERE